MFDFLFVSGVIVLGYLSSLLLNLNLNLIPDSPSEYELKRRARDGDAFAKKSAWVKKHAVEVDFIMRLLYLVLQSLFILVLSIRLGRVWPALIGSLVGFIILRVVYVRGLAGRMFEFWKKFFVEHAQYLVKLFGHVLKPLYKRNAKNKEDEYRSYYSEEEFIYRFGIDSGVLSEPIRNKVSRLIKGSKTRAKELMIEVQAIPRIDANLQLTPIIYDELHKKGYDMALVFQGGEENLVGLLYLSGPEAIDQLNSSSIRVADKMEQGLQYVTEDVKLDDLIAGFLQGGQNAVLVTGAGGRVSGVITSKKLLAWVSGV